MMLGRRPGHLVEPYLGPIFFIFLQYFKKYYEGSFQAIITFFDVFTEAMRSDLGNNVGPSSL